MTAETEVKVEKKKGGRPVGYSPKQETPGQPKQTGGIELLLEGEYVTLRIPKKHLTRKLLAELL